MKIATFNANSIRARLDVVVDWLQQHEPDILAIQETKVVDELFPVEAFENAGYHVVFKGQKAYNGVAIASREKATDVRYGLHDGGPADESRLISAKIGPVRMINTYVPQGRELDHEMYQYKLNWFKRLRKHFDKNFSTRMKLVWVGDLNVAREAMDIHNAEKQTNHVCYHVDVRHAFTDTMGWGFEDVFRKHCPEPGQYTFYDYRANSLKRGAGWRIDYVLATPSLARRSRTAYIDLEPRKVEKPSDHTFLVAEFDL
jgi:exodeoxyribonuclease-3